MNRFYSQTKGEESRWSLNESGWIWQRACSRCTGSIGNEEVRCRRQLRRSEVLKFFAGRPPCLIGMEACAGAHYWARELTKLGHTVKLMAPQLVKPYMSSQKNDANDAEGICEAVGRPKMRLWR